ncbi:MAG: hypothetical protein FJ138_03060 [Deltaproteobacteria bacterium]|nr:hypothetical protein [Deltaproteobacteria bacterium]
MSDRPADQATPPAATLAAPLAVSLAASLAASLAVSLAGCLPEPALTYPAPALDFGSPAAPLAPRLDAEPPALGEDLAAPDEGVDMTPDPPAPTPRLTTMGVGWVGAPPPPRAPGAVRLLGSFEWSSGALPAPPPRP